MKKLLLILSVICGLVFIASCGNPDKVIKDNSNKTSEKTEEKSNSKSSTTPTQSNSNPAGGGISTGGGLTITGTIVF